MPRTVANTLPGVAVGAEGVTVLSDPGDVAAGDGSTVAATGGVVGVACAVAITVLVAPGVLPVGGALLGPMHALSAVIAKAAMIIVKVGLSMILFRF